MLQNEKESEFSLSTLWQQLNFCILLQVALYPFSGRRDLVSAEHAFQYRPNRLQAYDLGVMHGQIAGNDGARLTM